MANRKPIFSFISMIILTTFLISVNSQQSEVSFAIDRFTPGDSRITLQGTASIQNGALALIDRTDAARFIGRALYSRQVRIWDRNGNIASFVTSFSLVVQNIPSPGSVPADGFIFFLSPTLQIPNGSNGGNLGVVNPATAFNNFVGVELDAYANRWDPNYPHIGIDVNSLYSLRTVRWNRISGQLVNVTVDYHSPSKTLTVFVTYQNGQTSTISQLVDLTAVLPETVWIGLSATTGSYRQLVDVRSWSFVSTFRSSSNNNNNNNLLSIIDQQK